MSLPLQDRLQPASTKHAMRVEEACERALRMVREGAPRREILTRLAAAAEMASGPGAVASILVLDHNGLLRNGASPNLPADYLDAIDRLKPDANLGTCAAAAATGEVVITPDFRADSKWAELRHLPIALGFVGAWSLPIKSAEGPCTRYLRHVLPGTSRAHTAGARSRANSRIRRGEGNRRSAISRVTRNQ